MKNPYEGFDSSPASFTEAELRSWTTCRIVAESDARGLDLPQGWCPSREMMIDALRQFATDSKERVQK